jgi:hypothetical protein
MNYPVFYFDSNAVDVREAEMPDADFRGGMNIACNSGGVGFATDNPNFKVQDYPIPSPNAIQRSGYIGGVGGVPGVVSNTAMSVGGGSLGNPPTGANSLITPVTASGAVAPGATVESVGGFAFTNASSKTLASGDRVFGVAANA